MSPASPNSDMFFVGTGRRNKGEADTSLPQPLSSVSPSCSLGPPNKACLPLFPPFPKKVRQRKDVRIRNLLELRQHLHWEPSRTRELSRAQGNICSRDHSRLTVLQLRRH